MCTLSVILWLTKSWKSNTLPKHSLGSSFHYFCVVSLLIRSRQTQVQFMVACEDSSAHVLLNCAIAVLHVYATSVKILCCYIQLLLCYDYNMSKAITVCEFSSEMERLNGSAALMLVTDLDSTLVDHDDPEDKSLLSLNALWESRYRPSSLLVFSTGRSPESYALLRESKPLLTPDILITSVGTEIFHGRSMISDSGWDELLSRGWDRNVVVQETSRFPELVPQPEMDQRPYKVSFFVDKASASKIIDALSKLLRLRGLDVKIVYSSGAALDVLPGGAGKGKALEYLLEKLESDGKRPVETLVCGDSGNDAELFAVTGVYGVMVSNAQEELLQWRSENAGDNRNIILAEERCAAGIIEAVGAFGLGPNVSPRDSKVEIVDPSYEVVKFYAFYEQWRRGEVVKSVSHLQDIKSSLCSLGSFVHPSGTEWCVNRCLDAMETCHGDMKGKRYKVWLDRLSTTQIGKHTWLVKCDKWDSFGDERQCCLTTILMSSEAEELNEYVWSHIQQTWSASSSVKDPDAWLL